MKNTPPQLQALHPPGDLNFNRQFWPEEQAIRDYWASAEGQEVVDKHFSLKKIRQYFRNRKPLAAADVDGWRGREHLAWMFMNNDTEFQELIRKELLCRISPTNSCRSMPRTMQEGSFSLSSKQTVDCAPLYAVTLGGDASRPS